ncbi:hypothetical protein M404DRAFT_1006975 [Pisolithus tinctorius Marx 270]|uniref:Uncharacterized protein n=1 Tax=Pisolithus tinctorius Marx 270 TaxID=870435 RepID=A0A0C3NKP1_PISTI|nr:hypothetical protein M404DRAFT_1006975 [Pisolithus tinctorius Marx 270]
MQSGGQNYFCRSFGSSLTWTTHDPSHCPALNAVLEGISKIALIHGLGVVQSVGTRMTLTTCRSTARIFIGRDKACSSAKLHSSLQVPTAVTLVPFSP